ncbi:hypothetical protein GQ457_11G023940 [Hibiscus cannabinus]
MRMCNPKFSFLLFIIILSSCRYTLTSPSNEAEQANKTCFSSWRLPANSSEKSMAEKSEPIVFERKECNCFVIRNFFSTVARLELDEQELILLEYASLVWMAYQTGF